MAIFKVVCDTAKVRFSKQITTSFLGEWPFLKLFAILQKYDFSSKSQQDRDDLPSELVVCDTAKVRFFKQITTEYVRRSNILMLFAILQKYDFSSKSQQFLCPSTFYHVVCDTAKVRFFKQITTCLNTLASKQGLFAILQKYDFSSKSQPIKLKADKGNGCLRYCKSTIFQANHNPRSPSVATTWVVCDTAKVRFFKQITTTSHHCTSPAGCLRYSITSLHPLT